MTTTAQITKLDDDHWSVVIETKNEAGHLVQSNGSTFIGKETGARKFAREVGGKGTKITVRK